MAPGARAGDLATLAPGTTNGGRPWTLLELVRDKGLPLLPGAPTLGHFPAELAEEQPLDVVWDGVAPSVRALADLVARYRLEVSLDLDDRVSFWRRGEGGLVGPQATPLSLDRLEVAEDVASVEVNHPPRLVLVLGGRRIVEVEFDRLEPVMEVDGEVLPQAEALDALGTSEAQARVIAFMNEEQRASVRGLRATAVREIDRCFSRWFRIPDASGVNAGALPLADRPDLGGREPRLAPPIVRSERFLQFRTAEVLRGGAVGSAVGVTARDVAHAIAALALGPIGLANLPFGPVDGWSLDRDRGIVQFSQLQGHVAEEGASLHRLTELRGAPRVALRCGRAQRPGLLGVPSASQRYASLWARGDPPRRVALATLAGAAPYVIERSDLVPLQDLEGRTNEAALDAEALALATAVYVLPSTATGRALALAGPIPVHCSGSVRSVQWGTAGGRPVTRVRLDSDLAIGLGRAPDHGEAVSAVARETSDAYGGWPFRPSAAGG